MWRFFAPRLLASTNHSHEEDLTVEEHLSFYASDYQVNDAHAKALGLLGEFELTSKLHTPANNLSRGMRQKLAICCAYLHDPQSILFDEPLTSLDPQGIRLPQEGLEILVRTMLVFTGKGLLFTVGLGAISGWGFAATALTGEISALTGSAINSIACSPGA